ncbi:KIF1-binding protein homolog [Fopius arisanus]|uniref:KIF-binding protein n=1 Tax=Fopius arisanus TaxID=64838 RepID=A0A9R1U1L1_9HYME|nr:PREDICTED: KIF1-binding protein homolog [Fopius arisanus]
MEEISKEDLEELREKYLKVRKLLDEPQDESNPGEGPDTATKNKAVGILNEMKSKLENLLNNSSSPRKDIRSSLAVVYLNIGIINIDNEELTDAEEHLVRCTEVLKSLELAPEGILPFLSTMNQLTIVWFLRSEFEKAKTFAERAESLYKRYKALVPPETPVGMSEVFGIDNADEPAPSDVLEKLHTLTLYYLAQIHRFFKDHQQAALYCHMTLERQLVFTDLNYIDWALNAATLSQYFTEYKQFPQARHHLAAATHILGIYQENLREADEKASESEEIRAAKWEQFRHRSADVARCWAKYGILLMSMSRDRLIDLNDRDDDEKELEINLMKINDDLVQTMKFEKLEKEIEPIEEQITDKFLLDFNDARKVFLNVQKWLEDAKKYYALETHASDYVHIVQDVSQSYKYLSFFEEDDDRQAKMHKRRIDVLEEVIKELNPRYYQTECRQIWIELGETSSAILDIKLDKLKASDERPTPHALNKINHLAKSGINYYQKFLDSLKENETSPSVKEFPKELVKPALIAYFHIGTFYNKIVTPDKLVQLNNLKASVEAYKFLVEYCKRDEEAAQFMQAELNVCKDLVNLLPLKVDKLTQSLHAS